MINTRFLPHRWCTERPRGRPQVQFPDETPDKESHPLFFAVARYPKFATEWYNSPWRKPWEQTPTTNEKPRQGRQTRHSPVPERNENRKPSLTHATAPHYLLHALAPWAVLASFGLIQARKWLLSWPNVLENPLLSLLTCALPTGITLWLLREKLPGPEWLTMAVIAICPFAFVALGWALPHPNVRFAAKALFGGLLIAYCFGHWYTGAYIDRHRHDAAFLQRVRQLTPSDTQLLVDMDVSALRAFLCLFYLDDDVVPLHNLSFVLDDRIQADKVYLITRYCRRKELTEIGTVQVVLQSKKTGGERSIEDRLTLFRVDYHDDVTRISSQGIRISPMQSMYRTAGPYLGPDIIRL